MHRLYHLTVTYKDCNTLNSGIFTFFAHFFSLTSYRPRDRSVSQLPGVQNYNTKQETLESATYEDNLIALNKPTQTDLDPLSKTSQCLLRVEKVKTEQCMEG